MTNTTVYCDRCSQQVNVAEQWNHLIMQGSVLRGTGKPQYSFDLCQACAYDVQQFIRGTMGDIR